MLGLYEITGYDGTIPLVGKCRMTLQGNRNKCTSDAKKFLKEKHISRVCWLWFDSIYHKMSHDEKLFL